jgi:hypothetical protein
VERKVLLPYQSTYLDAKFAQSTPAHRTTIRIAVVVVVAVVVAAVVAVVAVVAAAAAALLRPREVRALSLGRRARDANKTRIRRE